MVINIIKYFKTSAGIIIIFGTPRNYVLKNGMMIRNNKSELWKIKSISFSDFESTKNSSEDFIYKSYEVTPIKVNVDSKQFNSDYFLNNRWILVNE